MSYQDLVAADARLCMLKELGAQVDGRSNEVLLQHVLDAFGITKSRDWVRTQLRAMDELDAVKVTEMGSVFVVALTKKGRAHLDRREIIEGISRPSEED